MVGLVIFSVFLLVVIFADVIVGYKAALAQNIVEAVKPPSAAHWLGTDEFGRDIFARIVHGSRNSLLMGIGAVIVGVFFGCILAGIAGYYGGKLDAVITRVLDTIICIPYMVLALALIAALGMGLMNVLLALMIAQVPMYARVFRAAILSVGEQDFIEAARSYGTPDRFIILKHILPNAIGVVIVQATMSVGGMIIAASAMSYIGMGIQPPAPEWGANALPGQILYAVRGVYGDIPGACDHPDGPLAQPDRRRAPGCA